MRILWSSDQHLVHNKTPTKHILRNLSTFFYKDNNLDNVDLIIWGGDSIDRLVESTNRDFVNVLSWMQEFNQRCNEHNVKVRFLEGTSSHDWGQPEHFLFSSPLKSDIKYVDELSIETFPEFDNFTLMYVPDNMGNRSTDSIWETALQVLNNNQLTEVDMIAFHGAFEYQLPEKARKHAHNVDRWTSIVKYGIFAGHIHTPSQKKKIYCSGSFDRIRHGEEHPKGAYVIDLDKEKDFFNPVFYENKGALPYRQIRINKEYTVEELIKKIHTFIADNNLPKCSQIKIRDGLATVVNPVVSILSKEYPSFGFTVENDNEGEILIDESLFTPETYQGVSLTKDNLFDNLFNEIEQRSLLLDISKDDLFSVFKEFQ